MINVLILGALFVLLYLLPAYLSWRAIRWKYQNEFKGMNPDGFDMFFVLAPFFNWASIIAEIGGLLYSFGYKKRRIANKFFRLEDE